MSEPAGGERPLRPGGPGAGRGQGGWVESSRREDGDRCPRGRGGPWAGVSGPAAQSAGARPSLLAALGGGGAGEHRPGGADRRDAAALTGRGSPRLVLGVAGTFPGPVPGAGGGAEPSLPGVAPRELRRAGGRGQAAGSAVARGGGTSDPAAGL